MHLERTDLMVPRVGHSLPLRDPLLQVQRGDGHGALADPVGQPVREVDPPPVRTEIDGQIFPVRFVLPGQKREMNGDGISRKFDR